MKNDTMNKNRMNKRKLIALSLFAGLIIVFGVIGFLFREQAVVGNKRIVIEVVNQKEETKAYEMSTDAEFLKQAMEEAQGLTFSGEETVYGMTVYTVNGETADYNKGNAYWAFFVNGEYCKYGIDTQPIEDGDVFQIVYTEQ